MIMSYHWGVLLKSHNNQRLYAHPGVRVGPARQRGTGRLGQSADKPIRQPAKNPTLRLTVEEGVEERDKDFCLSLKKKILTEAK